MAVKLQCEICGGKLIGRPGGVFECDSCGMEYDTAWAKTKIQEITGTVKVEGTVEVTGKVQVDGPVKVEGGVNKEALLKRGRLALEDGQWDKAKEFFDQALSLDAEYADAWLGLVMAELHLHIERDFEKMEQGKAPVENSADFQKFLRFAAPERARQLLDLLEYAQRVKEEREEAERNEAERYRVVDLAAREAFRREMPNLQKRVRLTHGIIAAGGGFTVGLKTDGTVVAAGDNHYGQCNVHSWRNIAAVAAGSLHTVGLKEDGTVLAVGYDDARCRVSHWRDIIGIAAGGGCTIGWKADGTVVAAGENTFGECNVSGWHDIVDVLVHNCITYGLKSDGTVVAAGQDLGSRRLEVSSWRDVAAIAGGEERIWCLKTDGSVMKIQYSGQMEELKSPWRGIVTIAACGRSIWGLKADGTVERVGAAVRYKKEAHRFLTDPKEVENAVAISCGGSHYAVLRADGRVFAYGNNTRNQCETSHWKLFNSVDTLKAEREAALAKRTELEEERSALSKELANLTGLFTGKRRKEIEARLAEIFAELKKLS